MSVTGAVTNDQLSPRSLHALNKRVKDLQDRESQILLDLADVRDSLAHARCVVAEVISINRGVAIYSLPPEILATIFEASKHMPLVWSGFRTLLNITHVSRRWREVALQRPSIWTHLKLTEGLTLKLLEIVLERSKACFLDITIYAGMWDGPKALLILHRILSEAHRWRGFTVEGNIENLTLTFETLQEVCFPNLESLKVRLRSSGGDLELETDIFGGGVPKLSTVEFIKMNFVTFSPPLAAVTSLKLDCGYVTMSHEEFRCAVAASPGLQSLCLHQATVTFEDELAPIKIPGLLSLDYFCGDAPLPRWVPFVLPVLEHLCIRTSSLSSMAIIARSLLTDELLPKYPTVHSFKLHSASLEIKVALDFITALPAVTHFAHLNDSSPSGDIFFDHLSIAIRTSYAFWPNLRSVAFYHNSRKTPRIIYKFVANCCKNGRPITHLRSPHFLRFPEKYRAVLLQSNVRLEDCPRLPHQSIF